MSADPVILDTDGVGHLVRDTIPPVVWTICCALRYDYANNERHPISRLTCPDCIRIHREHNAAATEGADHD